MRALVVDDEANIRKVLKMLLTEGSFEVNEAGTLTEAIRQIENYVFDLALIDLRLPDGSGMDLLRKAKEINRETVVLVITAFGSAETAIQAMKLGAYDYLTKPFNLDELRVIFSNIAETISLHKKVRELQQYADAYQLIIGKSEAMRRVFNMVEKIAPFDTGVLIYGETGTGKELVAKALHDKSRRAPKPFVAINCASLPGELLESELFGYTKGSFTGAYSSKRGLIEDANGGTLFLDEIAEMPLSLQSKLLRFLENKRIRPLGSSAEIEVDVRIIAATNKNLRDLQEKGDFRDDLYYRLATFEMQLPSLKERREDIPLLIDHFSKVLSKKFGKTITKIDPGFIDQMMRQEFKGNVRELKNIIEREVILTEDGCLRWTSLQPGQAQPAALSELPESGMNLNDYLAGIEKTLLTKALQKANGVKTKAAEFLGISFREYRYRLSKFKEEEPGAAASSEAGRT